MITEKLIKKIDEHRLTTGERPVSILVGFEDFYSLNKELDLNSTHGDGLILHKVKIVPLADQNTGSYFCVSKKMQENLDRLVGWTVKLKSPEDEDQEA